jgi:hypothetical protein
VTDSAARATPSPGYKWIVLSNTTIGMLAMELYGADMRDPSLYHLVIDSTTLPREACVELISLACRCR